MLSAYITDLLGNHLARVGSIPAQGGGNRTAVKAALNGERTASVRVSAGDAATVSAVQARPGTRMLKVYYRPPTVLQYAKLVFWGGITRPVIRMGERVLEVQAKDPAHRAKRAFASLLGPPGGEEGVTIDGRGLETIWEAQVAGAAGLGVPTPGVVWSGGRHGTTSDRKVSITAGQSYQGLADTISDAVDGPDWILRPIDPLRPPGERVLPEGFNQAEFDALAATSPASTFYTQLHTYDFAGNDLRDLIFFQFNTGVDNLEDLEIEVGGEQTINAAVVTISKAEETAVAGAASDMGSIGAIGIYGETTALSVDPSGDADTAAQATADAQVATHSRPPVFLTPVVKKDELARFYPFFTYDLGDIVTVGGEQGALLIPYLDAWVRQVPARVTEIELQEDEQGRVQQVVTTVVHID